MAGSGNPSAVEEIPEDHDDDAPSTASLLSVTMRTGQPRIPSRSSVAPPEPVVHRDIAGYWRSLIVRGKMPPVGAIDRGFIDETWPRTLLLSCRWDRDGLKLDMVYSRLWYEGATPQFDDETCELLFETMVGHGHKVVETGRPVMAVHHVGPVRLQLTALPLGADSQSADHVLCQIETLDN
jgi:hypothetical protein